MRRRFKFKPRLEVDNSFFQGTVTLFEGPNAAVEFVVRELDHRLRVGEATLHPLLEFVATPVHHLVSSGNRLDEGLDSPLETFGNIEVAARFDEQPLQLIVGHRFSFYSATVIAEMLKKRPAGEVPSGSRTRESTN